MRYYKKLETRMEQTLINIKSGENRQYQHYFRLLAQFICNAKHLLTLWKFWQTPFQWHISFSQHRKCFIMQETLLTCFHTGKEPSTRCKLGNDGSLLGCNRQSFWWMLPLVAELKRHCSIVLSNISAPMEGKCHGMSGNTDIKLINASSSR